MALFEKRPPGRPSFRDMFVIRFREQLEDGELGAVMDRCAGRLNDVVSVSKVKRLEVLMNSGETEVIEL